MSARRLRAVPGLTALLVFITTFTYSQTVPAIKHGSVERIKVHGAALEANLEGDSADRDVSIYLPPSYHAQKHRRYPVVYLLHGFTDTDLRWFGNEHPLFDGAAAADRAFSNGTREMIVVMPNAKTRYFGSMYSNSVTTGDWERFVAHDLVAFIDSHYRTIPHRMSRGLAGHSMGGYGTIRLGMKYPDVFSSIYALSACCLAPAPNMQNPAGTKIADIQSDEELGKADFFTKAAFASAAAWSPDPKNPPRFIDFPWKDGQFQPLIAEKWAANAPLIMLDQYVPNLKSLHAIAFDIGTRDFLKPGVEALDGALTVYGIAHTYETYDGDHLNRIEMRFEKNVLPFFATNLEFGR
jgi:S-formylglutathione hydrolase FrmB